MTTEVISKMHAGAGRPNANSTSADALAIPEINVKLKSEAIVAKTRKLKAQWTPEFAQDLERIPITWMLKLN